MLFFNIFKQMFDHCQKKIDKLTGFLLLFHCAVEFFC